ncbi:hypothetical protein INT45_004578 [Circinella minor]|uniref:C2H2-type domain-containing protein n=1 Tax=Circinella minor TaxID=1195481 RepID=A0A8H7VJW5_9FUNG|nr:hypothetical protein INT45_004578 [Circinella minor]
MQDVYFTNNNENEQNNEQPTFYHYESLSPVNTPYLDASGFNTGDGQQQHWMGTPATECSSKDFNDTPSTTGQLAFTPIYSPLLDGIGYVSSSQISNFLAKVDPPYDFTDVLMDPAVQFDGNPSKLVIQPFSKEEMNYQDGNLLATPGPTPSPFLPPSSFSFSPSTTPDCIDYSSISLSSSPYHCYQPSQEEQQAQYYNQQEAHMEKEEEEQMFPPLPVSPQQEHQQEETLMINNNEISFKEDISSTISETTKKRRRVQNKFKNEQDDDDEYVPTKRTQKKQTTRKQKVTKRSKTTKSSNTQIFKFKNKKASSPEKEYNKRPYACPICQLRFNRSYNLRTHQLTHDKNRPKPFSCDVCEKTFARKHDRDRHVSAVHAGERLYQCTVCDASFARRTYLTSHMSVNHSL